MLMMIDASAGGLLVVEEAKEAVRLTFENNVYRKI